MVYVYTFLSCVGECIWFTLDFTKEVLENCKKYFPVCKYAFVTIPSYPCGQIGFVIASRDKVRMIPVSKALTCSLLENWLV